MQGEIIIQNTTLKRSLGQVTDACIRVLNYTHFHCTQVRSLRKTSKPARVFQHASNYWAGPFVLLPLAPLKHFVFFSPWIRTTWCCWDVGMYEIFEPIRIHRARPVNKLWGKYETPRLSNEKYVSKEQQNLKKKRF